MNDCNGIVCRKVITDFKLRIRGKIPPKILVKGQNVIALVNQESQDLGINIVSSALYKEDDMSEGGISNIQEPAVNLSTVNFSKYSDAQLECQGEVYLKTLHFTVVSPLLIN